MIKAFRDLLTNSSGIALAVSMIALSACTTSSGTDISSAGYNVNVGQDVSQTALDTTGGTAPDQAPNVVVSAGGALSNQKLDPLEAIASTEQAFVPGAVPPSAILPDTLTAATEVNANVGASTNSGDYVTDGVVRQASENSAQSSTPLTPSDVAGQVPNANEAKAPDASVTANTTPAQKPVQQIAVLDVEETKTSNPADAGEPVVAAKTSRAKPTLFGGLFGNKPAKEKQTLSASPDDNNAVQLASLDTSTDSEPRQTEEMSALPGVNTKNLFALDPGSKSNEEEYAEEEPEVQVASASAAGLARLAPNGLLKQTDRVEVGCFKPELVSVLKKIERHYGSKVIVTSGYRSPTGNRRAGGSKRSLHMSCAAADIQVSGVGKWQLAKFLRSMPGRGGVGTYCYTDSVHIDVGSERDWNWRCRRR